MEVFFVSNAAPVEVWQWLYVGIISLTIPLFCVPIAMWSSPRNTNTFHWLVIPAYFGMMVWFTPHGLLGVYLLWCTLGILQAPIGASIIVAGYCIGALGLTTAAFFGTPPRRTW